VSGQLEGRVALISGGSRGQGAAEARLFASEGASVVVCDVLDEQGEETVAAIERDGGEAIFVRLDVADEAAWSAAVDRVRRDFGALHVLVNNAGVLSRAGIIDTSVEEWERVLDINLTGTFLGMRAAAPLMRDSGGGAIVNISSIAGLVGTGAAAYSASKWGVRGLSKVAALEFAPWRIRVNSVHPGVVETAMTAEFAQAAAATVPLGRVSQPEEIAQLVLFLASERSSYLSGSEIAIDGGRVAGLGGSVPRVV
jgi:3alpha(or 20beta)-hydroxysteroid dehydrogenase